MRPHLSTCRHSAFCANNLTHNDSFKVLFSNHPTFYNFFSPKFSYWKWLEKSGNQSKSRLLFTLSDYFSGWYSTVFLLTHPFWQILISLIEKYWAIIASVFSLLLLWKISKAKPKREWKGATVVIWVISFEVTDYQVLLLLPEIILKLQQQPSFLRCNSPLIFMPI